MTELIQAERALGRIERRADLCTSAYEILRAEFLRGVNRPEMIVRTPGFGPGAMTAADICLDQMESDRMVLVSAIRMMSDASQGVDVQLRASAWIAERANKHAAWHKDDLAIEIEAGESDK